MNPEFLLRLCSFAYLNLPECYIRRLRRGERVPLAEVADALKRMDDLGALSCGAYLKEAGAVLAALRETRLFLIAYEDDNADTGFVAYAFRAPGGETVVAVRGSEGRGSCAPTLVDWRDNFCAPLTGSVQYAAATAFADRFPTGALTLTGHSKGGNVALWAQGSARNARARATVFNAQGFARDMPDRARRRRMRRGAVNYVVAGDAIGALLYHPERRVYVAQAPGADAHAPDAYVFTEDGRPVRAARTPVSRVLEWLSRALLLLDRAGVTDIARLLRCPTPGAP